MSSYNYEFDFYTWEKDIQCADIISKNMAQTSIKDALKNAIQIAIETEIHKHDSPTNSNKSFDFTALKDAIQLSIHKNVDVDDNSRCSTITYDDNVVNYKKKRIIKYKIKIKMKIKNENEKKNKYCAWFKSCFLKK